MATSSKARRNQTAAAHVSGAARSTLLWVFIAIGALLVAGALTATSLGDRIGLKFSPAPSAAAKSNGAQAKGRGSAVTEPFGIDDLRSVVAVLSEAERARVIGDKAAFAQLVQREAARRSLIRAAQSAGLDSRPEIALLMQRNSEQVLVDSFVQLKAGAALSAEFPSDAQVKAFYENNPERFRLDERIPVWQIFLSAPKDGDPAAVTEIEKQAKATAKALKSGTLTFAEAAAQNSDHEPSRLNGGFMGNLRISELIPEIKAVAVEAKPGEISGPVRSAAGFHLIKRGERIEARTLPLERVAPQIRASMRQAAETRARQRVVTQAQQQFGVTLSEAELERWRQTLGNDSIAAKRVD